MVELFLSTADNPQPTTTSTRDCESTMTTAVGLKRDRLRRNDAISSMMVGPGPRRYCIADRSHIVSDCEFARYGLWHPLLAKCRSKMATQ